MLFIEELVVPDSTGAFASTPWRRGLAFRLYLNFGALFVIQLVTGIPSPWEV